jgi:death-on-curing protein
VKYLTLEEVLRLHFQVIEEYGGSHGIRDDERLQSVVLAPQQEIFGKEQYPDVYEKAAVYMRNIIGDHAFTDGNKRSGVTVAGVFLIRNGILQTATPKELEDFAVEVAVERLDVPTIAAWLRAQSKTA